MFHIISYIIHYNLQIIYIIFYIINNIFLYINSYNFPSLGRPLPAWEFKDYLGWMEQGDGKLAYGVFVQNGRLKGEAKRALRTIIERYELPVIITPNQNLVLAEIDPSWKADILTTLGKAGVRCGACPAPPAWPASFPARHSRQPPRKTRCSRRDLIDTALRGRFNCPLCSLSLSASPMLCDSKRCAAVRVHASNGQQCHLGQTAMAVLGCCRDVVDIDGIDRFSMACPALPLCGLAISEAERGLPDVNKRIRALLDHLGFDESEQFVVRMTGCPNGCSRPYMAELGFVGDGPNSYQLWLGGTPSQTRLAEPFMERMKIQVFCRLHRSSQPSPKHRQGSCSSLLALPAQHSYLLQALPILRHHTPPAIIYLYESCIMYLYVPLQ